MNMKVENRDRLMERISAEPDVPLTYEEWKQEASQKMSSGGFGYVSTGAGGEETASRNAQAFKKWAMIPRMLNDVSQVDMKLSLFGRTYDNPFFLSPIGMQRLANEEGELATARAAANMNVPLIVSTVSSYSIEDIASAAPNSSKWFQLYWSGRSKDISFSMVERAEQAGYEAVVLTVDTVMLGWREGDLRNKFSPLSQGFGMANFEQDPVFMKSLPDNDFDSIIEGIVDCLHHPALDWKNVRELKERTNLPILIKGILHPEDAREAVENGADGIIVSNHGGRQLDGVIASIDALPAIVEAVQGQIPVLLDSGIRRGIDAVKALALGADGVLIGRPFYYALAARGQEGVEKFLERFIQEAEVSLALSGVSKLSEAAKIKMVRQ